MHLGILFVIVFTAYGGLLRMKTKENKSVKDHIHKHVYQPVWKGFCEQLNQSIIDNIWQHTVHCVQDCRRYIEQEVIKTAQDETT